jgi:hypothetical protein
LSIFAYKLFNAPLDFGVCVCVSEAVFHSIQIRTKKNRGEEAKGKKEEEAADFVGYLFHFFFISLSTTKGLGGSFFGLSNKI